MNCKRLSDIFRTIIPIVILLVNIIVDTWPKRHQHSWKVLFAKVDMCE